MADKKKNTKNNNTKNNNTATPAEIAEMQQLGRWLLGQNKDKIQKMVDDDILFIPPPLKEK